MADVNKKLLRIQETWAKEVGLKNLAEGLADGYSISKPFCFAITEQYWKAQKRVMIVGQEPDGFPEFCSSEELFENQQDFTSSYVKSQLMYPGGAYKVNGSPFWNLFRKIHEKGIEPIWNNVDKCHRLKYLESKEKTYPLSVEIEYQLSKSYGDDNKSLLRREIEITKPTVVLFVTGPYYHKTMSIALAISDEELSKKRPCKEHPCNNISELANLGIQVFWSYHPKYLQMKRKLELVIETIID